MHLIKNAGLPKDTGICGFFFKNGSVLEMQTNWGSCIPLTSQFCLKLQVRMIHPVNVASTAVWNVLLLNIVGGKCDWNVMLSHIWTTLDYMTLSEVYDYSTYDPLF